MKLLDFLKAQKTSEKLTVAMSTFAEAKNLYLREVEIDPALSKRTIECKHFILKLISRTWPGLDLLFLDQIDMNCTLEWAARLSKEVSAQAFNDALGVFKNIFPKGRSTA